MRRRLRRALEIIGALLLTAPSAAAYSMSLTWIDTDGAGITGSNSIAARPGDEVTLQIDFSPEGTEIGGLFFSADYDMDGMNELDLVSCTTTPFHLDAASGAVYSRVVPCGGPPGSAYPNVESDLGLTGQVNALATLMKFSGPLQPGQSSGIIVIGEMTFRVNQPLTDGADISVGVLRGGLDALLTNTGENLLPSYYNQDPLLFRTVLGTASVMTNPEPSTAALLGLGLIGLGAARRRRRH